MRIIGYARVSTEEQAVSGLGLAAQEQAILAECGRRDDWELLEIVRDEGFSAKTLERPGLQGVLARIAANEADGLVVAKLDRLSRSVIDFSLLLEWFTEEVEATLVALDVEVDTSTASGKLVAGVIALVAEWEREIIGDRTRAGHAALRAQGKPTGRPSVADRPELAARIRSMRKDGMTLEAIADKLNAEGVPTARGAEKWRKSSVQTAAGHKRRKPRRRPTSLPRRSRR